MSITVETDDRIESASLNIEAKRYFVGLTQDAPFDFVTCGGICFPRRTHDAMKVGESEVSIRRGDVLWLTPAKKKRVDEAMRRKVVQFTGSVKNPVAQLASKSAAPEAEEYRQTGREAPLEKYLIFREAKSDDDLRGLPPEADSSRSEGSLLEEMAAAKALTIEQAREFVAKANAALAQAESNEANAKRPAELFPKPAK